MKCHRCKDKALVVVPMPESYADEGHALACLSHFDDVLSRRWIDEAVDRADDAAALAPVAICHPTPSTPHPKRPPKLGRRDRLARRRREYRDRMRDLSWLAAERERNRVRRERKRVVALVRAGV